MNSQPETSTTIATATPTLPRLNAPAMELEHRKPRCPFCGKGRLKANRSDKLDDGSRVRHTRCQDCGQLVRLTIR